MEVNQRLIYQYDPIGMKKTMDVASAGRYTYIYRSDQQIDRMITPWNERVTSTYDAAGRSKVQYNPNATRSSYTYDNADRTTRLANIRSASTTISSFDYRYDNTGNKTNCVENNGNRTTWTYDNSYQLTRERRNGTGATVTYDTTFTYDPAMNRKVMFKTGARTTYAYDTANQIRRFKDSAGITSFTFDAAGNQTLQRPPASGTRTTWTYDADNQVKVNHVGTTRTTYAYDPDFHRISRQDATITTTSRWDMENVVQETAGATTTNYILQPAYYGLLTASRTNSATTILHPDDIYSIITSTDATGAKTNTYIYNAFGEIVNAATPLTFGWKGKIGYYSNGYVRRRQLQSIFARWLSVDPLTDILFLLNVYQYARNTPLTSFDPSGMYPCQKSPCETLLTTLLADDSIKKLIKCATASRGLIYPRCLSLSQNKPCIKCKEEDPSANSQFDTQDGCITIGSGANKQILCEELYHAITVCRGKKSVHRILSEFYKFLEGEKPPLDKSLVKCLSCLADEAIAKLCARLVCGTGIPPGPSGNTQFDSSIMQEAPNCVTLVTMYSHK